VRATGSLVDRYYDPTTDQFWSVDPDVAETGQPYAFTADNPLNSTDPLGLKAKCKSGHGCSNRNKTSKHKVKKHTNSVPIPGGEADGVNITISASFSFTGPDIDPSVQLSSQGDVAVSAPGVARSSISISDTVNATLNEQFDDGVGASLGAQGLDLSVPGPKGSYGPFSYTSSVDISLEPSDPIDGGGFGDLDSGLLKVAALIGGIITLLTRAPPVPAL
jgi:hypothetical protein